MVVLIPVRARNIHLLITELSNKSVSISSALFDSLNEYSITIVSCPQSTAIAVGTCSLTRDRTLIAEATEWFVIFASLIGTTLPKTIEEQFLVFKVFDEIV